MTVRQCTETHGDSNSEKNGPSTRRLQLFSFNLTLFRLPKFPQSKELRVLVAPLCHIQFNHDYPKLILINATGFCIFVNAHSWRMEKCWPGAKGENTR